MQASPDAIKARNHARAAQRAARYHTLWRIIHVVAWAYPEAPTVAQQADMRRFFQGINTLIPCGLCRRHYTEYLRRNPLPVHAGSALYHWTIHLHNHINKRNRKPVLSIAQATEALRPRDTIAQLAARSRPFLVRAWVQQAALHAHLRAM